MQAEGRRWATPWRLAQAAVSLGLIGWMVSTVDKSMLAAAAVLDPVIFLLAALLFASAQIFGGLRLATLFPGEVTPRDAVVMTWAGYFLSNFLPGTIGGDVYKAVRLKSAGMTLPAAAGGLLLDRLLNTVVLVILAALTAAPVVLAMAGGIDPRLAAIAGLALAAIAAAGVHMARRQSRIGEIMTLAAGPFSRLLESPGRSGHGCGVSRTRPGPTRRLPAARLPARRLDPEGHEHDAGPMVGDQCRLPDAAR